MGFRRDKWLMAGGERLYTEWKRLLPGRLGSLRYKGGFSRCQAVPCS